MKCVNQKWPFEEFLKDDHAKFDLKFLILQLLDKNNTFF